MKTVKQATVELRRLRDRIGKERDALRNLHQEVEDLLESTGRGLEALDEAIDALSELA